MGKAIIRKAGDNDSEGPSRDKFAGKIRISKTRKNLKLNILIILGLLNLTLNLYILYLFPQILFGR